MQIRKIAARIVGTKIKYFFGVKKRERRLGVVCLSGLTLGSIFGSGRLREDFSGGFVVDLVVGFAIALVVGFVIALVVGFVTVRETEPSGLLT